MIEEIGIITAVRTGEIQVQTRIKSTCGTCEAASNCGTSTIAKAFAPRAEDLVLPCDMPAEVGQQVKLGIPEQHLLSASVWVYMLPLAALIITALAAQHWLPAMGLHGEGWVIASAFAATAVAFGAIRRYLSAHQNGRFRPQVLAILPAPAESIAVRQIP